MPEVSKTQKIGSLLSNTTRVESPFVRVSMGGFTFGVYQGKSVGLNESGVRRELAENFPNYIQEMKIEKINGTVNQYELDIKYPITEFNDPNFFEKIFSKTGYGGKIEISYGDFMLPEYIYRDEEAIVTQITNTFDIRSAVISYKIKAVSTSRLSLSATYSFPATTAKPSEIIKNCFNNSKYHLREVFKGMRNIDEFIVGDDQTVNIPTCTNMSILQYIATLVNYMEPAGTVNNKGIKNNVYALTTYEDVNREYGGSYFKIQKIQSPTSENAIIDLCSYDVDIGFPTANVVTSFSINENQNWSMLYNYNQTLGQSDYLKRINDQGEIEYIYSPQLTNNDFEMSKADSTWWTKVTEYPIQASLTVRGLLKPAILMQYIKLNVWFYGRKHISSGVYMVIGQTDRIGLNGYFTDLKLLRISREEEI